MRENTVNLREEEMARPMPPLERVERPRNRFSPKTKMIALIVAGVLVIWYAWSMIAASMTWRAIFLANNQVYFGHFWDVPFASKITLRDVYYLQVAQPDPQLSGQDQSQLKLIKLGNEIHGPTSEMVIPISQVLFWETLRSDSTIVKTIENGQSQN